MNDLEHFGEKALVMFGVKIVLPMAGFEGIGLSFSAGEAGLNISGTLKMLIKCTK